MTSHSRRAAAIAVAFILSVPVFAGAPRDERGQGTERGAIVRVVEKIKKVLGISTNSTYPSPPVGPPTP